MCAKFDDSSFSRSKDMVDAHQNLNDSCDLTVQGRVAIRGLAHTTINLSTEFDVSISTQYEDMKRDTKCQN